MYKMLFLFLILILCKVLYSQSDCVSVNSIEKNDTLIFTFCNNTDDTLYLFNTYFSNSYLDSKFLHKINKETHIYTISFIPYIPYIAGYHSGRYTIEDREIKTDIVKFGQNVYSFVKIFPDSTEKIKFISSNIFKNSNKKKNVVSEFNNITTKSTKVKTLTLNKLNGIYKLFFEFAIYNKVDLLLTRDEYIKGGLDTFKQSLNYVIISQPVFLINYNLPIEIKIKFSSRQ